MILSRLYKLLFVLLLLPSISWSNSTLEQQINELSSTIDQKSASRNSLQQKFDSNTRQRRELRSKILDLDLELKNLNRQERKIIAMSSPGSEAEDKNALRTITYKRKVAELDLERSNATLETLKREQTSIMNRIERQGTLIQSMEAEIIVLQQQKSDSAKKKAQQDKIAKQQAQKARQRQLAANQAAAQAKAEADLASKQALEKAEQAKLEQEQQALKAQQEASLTLLNSLPAKAQTAYNKAQFQSQKNMQGTAKFGDNPMLQVSNPIGSPPEDMSTLKHLGNHQYLAVVTAKAGKQHFIVNGFKYTQTVPAYRDGKDYLLLIDARKGRPTMQLLAI